MKKSSSDMEELTALYINLAVLCVDMKRNIEVRNYLGKAVETLCSVNNEIFLAQAYSNIGCIYQREGMDGEAGLYLKRALALAEKLEKLAKAENPDVAEIAKLAEKKQQLDKDSETKLGAAAKKLVGMELPYELSEGLFYSIASQPMVTEAKANGTEDVTVSVSFRIKINAPLRQ